MSKASACCTIQPLKTYLNMGGPDGKKGEGNAVTSLGPDDLKAPKKPRRPIDPTETAPRTGRRRSPLRTFGGGSGTTRLDIAVLTAATGAFPAAEETSGGIDTIAGATDGFDVFPDDSDSGEITGPERPNLSFPVPAAWPAMNPNSIEVEFDDEEDEAMSPTRSQVPATLINASIASGMPLDELLMQVNPTDIGVVYDVAGNTRAMRKLKDRPEIIEDHLNPIHEIITRNVLKFGGDIFMYEGDAQLAIFPADNEIGESNASYYIGRETARHFEAIHKAIQEEDKKNLKPEEIDPEGQIIGLRCVKFSPKGLCMHTERKVGAVPSHKEALKRRSKAESRSKTKEMEIPARERIGAYYFEVIGTDATIVNRLTYPTPPPPYTGKPTKIRYMPGGMAPDPEGINQEIKTAIEPKSAEERVALMPTNRNVGLAVYIELMGIENPSQLRNIREVIATHYAQYGASIDKAMGDTLLVSFGAGFNIDQKDMLERAIRASVETKMWLKTEIQPHLHVTAAIGVSNLDLTTRVTVGTKERNDSTNLGDTHNTGARVKAEAAARARTSFETVIMVGEEAAGLQSFCEAEELEIEGVRGIGTMKMSKISDVKPPQKTKFHTNEDFVPPLVAGQEVPYREFSAAVEARPITIISSASTVIQDLFCQRLLKKVNKEGEEIKSDSEDLLCTLTVESADQYIDYKSLHDLLNDLQKSSRFEASLEESIDTLSALIEDVAQMTGVEREEGHLAITRSFIEILQALDATLDGTFYLAILETDVMDARSREVFEEAFQINSPTLKLILAGHDLPNSNVETSMDDLTVAGAKEIITFVLRTEIGADQNAVVVDDETLLKLARPLIEPREVKGVLDSEGRPLKVYTGAVNLTSINVYLRFLISKAAIKQVAGKWEIAEGAVLKYSKAEMFVETIGPLTRRFGERKGKRLQNLALCFGMVNEFLSFKDIPSGTVRNEEEFDEFTLLLAEKGILKKAPQVDEEKVSRLFNNESFELEPRLRGAAEECSASDRDSKGKLHFAIAAKYRNDPFEIDEIGLEGETDEEKTKRIESVRTKRSHFLDHAKKHFEIAEINEKNIELLLHYLRVLKKEVEEDFEISAPRVLDRLLTEHNFEALTKKVLPALLPPESEKNETLTEAKIELMELLSLLGTAGYRTINVSRTKWLTDENSKVLNWKEHMDVSEEQSTEISIAVGLMRIRKIKNEIYAAIDEPIVHATSAKEASKIATEQKVMTKVKALTHEAERLIGEVISDASTAESPRAIARIADIMHIYAESHVLHAKALKRVEGYYEPEAGETSAEEHLKIAKECCDRCRDIADEVRRLSEPSDIPGITEASRAALIPTLSPEGEEAPYSLVQPYDLVVQSLKNVAQHVDGVAAIAATNLEFFDMLPWITERQLSVDECEAIYTSSLPNQLTAVSQSIQSVLTISPGLTEGRFSFEKNLDVASSEDSNFDKIMERASKLIDIKNKALEEGGQRIYPNKILNSFIQLTESMKVLGRSIFAPHWDKLGTTERESAHQKYLTLLSKARALGMSASEVNGFPVSDKNNITAAFAEFIARFNTTEADIDRAAISTPEEMPEVQTLFEESMNRMLELRAFCDKKDGSPVLCAGAIPLDHELGKLCYEAKLAGLNIVKYEQFDTAS